MASGLITGPTTRLRLAPLISSTCTLWFAWDKNSTFSILASLDHEAESNAILPHFWRKLVDMHDIKRVVFPIAITTATSILNLRKYGSLLRARGGWNWYVAGAALALGHLAFVPGVLWKIQAMIEDNGKDEAVAWQRKWLVVHRLRTMTVDLGAWIACLVAVTRTVS